MDIAQVKPKPPVLKSIPNLLSGFVRSRSISTNDTGHISLAFDPSESPDVTGYILYYGTNSAQYYSTNNIGNITVGSINGLVPGRVYYFASTAYDDECLESEFSNEISASLSTEPIISTPSTEPVTITDAAYSKAKDPHDCKEYLYTTFKFIGQPGTKYAVDRKSGNGAWEEVERYNIMPYEGSPETPRGVYCNYRSLAVDAPLVLFYRVRTITD